MGWNGTKTWTVGDVPGGWSSSIMNQYVRDNVQYCRDTVRIASVSGVMGAVWNNAASGVPSTVPVATIPRLVFRKREATSWLTFKVWIQGWSSAGATSFNFGVQYTNGPNPGGINLGTGSPGPVTRWFNNTFYINQIMYDISAGTEVPGLYTARVLVWNSVGAGAYNVSTGCSYHIEAREQNRDDV